MTEQEAKEHNQRYAEKFKAFGEGYMAGAEPIADAVARYSKKIEDEYAWEDDKEIYAWLKTL